MSENTMELVNTFNFRVKLRDSSSGSQLGEGAFQECSGLQIEMDVQQFEEGGRNDGVVQQVGRGKYQPLVLKRGMFVEGDTVDGQLWSWLMRILEGRRPVVRYDGVVEVLDRAGEAGGRVVATWSFERGLPAKIVGPTLNGKSGDIAIEEIHIAHEGLRLVVDA